MRHFHILSSDALRGSRKKTLILPLLQRCFIEAQSGKHFVLIQPAGGGGDRTQTQAHQLQSRPSLRPSLLHSIAHPPVLSGPA